MIDGFLLDENLPKWWRRAIIGLRAQIVVWAVGDGAAPPLGTLDPAILDWCERFRFALVTDNRRTMPRHLADHVAAGRHVPGIFLVGPKFSIHDLVDELHMIFEASRPYEFQDRIEKLPL